jgi:hypothetical protein
LLTIRIFSGIILVNLRISIYQRVATRKIATMHQPEREIIQTERSQIEGFRNRALALVAAGALASAVGGETAQAQQPNQSMAKGDQIEFAVGDRTSNVCRNFPAPEPRNRGKSATGERTLAGMSTNGLAANIAYFGSAQNRTKLPLDPANRMPKGKTRKVCFPSANSPQLKPDSPSRRPLSVSR